MVVCVVAGYVALFVVFVALVESILILGPLTTR